MNVLFYFGVAIVVTLAGVAVYYQVLVYRKTRKDSLAEKALAVELDERRVRNKNSIVVIARALVDGQVSLTEASIRINAISQSMSLDGAVIEALSVFRQVAEATSHIPILEKWRDLSRKRQLAYDIERAKIEDNFHEFALQAAKKIIDGNIQA